MRPLGKSWPCALALGAGLWMAGCDDSPTVAKMPPAFEVFSGDSASPVSGARVVIGGASYTSDARGFVYLKTVPEAAAPVEIFADGFLERRTTFGRRGADRFTLWPRANAAGLDEQFTKEIVYTSSNLGVTDPPLAADPMRRWSPDITRVEVVRLGPEDDARYLAFSDTVMARHRQAIAEMNISNGNRIVYGDPREGDDAATPGTLRLRIFPEYPGCVSSPTTDGITTVDGLTLRAPIITYCRATPGLGLIVHELGHTFGLRHTASASDVMYRSSIRVSSFSPRERTTLVMLTQRAAGNRFPDTDPPGLTAASRRSEDIACE